MQQYMAGENTDTPSFEEIEGRIKEPQERLLSVASAAAGEIGMSELRSQAEIPRGSKFHYIDPLVDWGLLELVGKRDMGQTMPSNVYRLTDRGQEFLDRPGTTTWVSEEELQVANERISKLKATMQATVQVMGEELTDEAADRVLQYRDEILDGQGVEE